MLSTDKQLTVSVTSVDGDDIETATEQVEWKPKKEEWLIMATLSISSLVVALDSTILVTVLPTLASELKGTTQETFWAGTSYLLANAVLQPFIASLSDVFGRRELLLPSILLFLIGSIICSVANNLGVLLPGRVIQGIGGGGIVALTQLIFADIVPLRQRPKFFSVVLLSWAVGTVLGPVLGGTLVEKSTWRWCFYLNFPICTVALVMAFLFVKLTLPKTSLQHKLLRIDWIGNFLLLSSLTSFLMAISWGGTTYPWSSWQTLIPLILGAVGIIFTIMYEKFIAKNPFLHKALFCSPSAIFSYICALLHGIALMISLYYLPFYFTSVKLKSPTQSGASLLAALLPLLPASAIVSLLITRLARYRPFIWTGSILSTLGAGLFILFDTSTPKPLWIASMCIFGLGMGMLLSSINFSVQAVTLDPDYAARAASMYAFMRAVGMSLGVGIGGSVFQNSMKSKLSELGLDGVIASNAEGFVAILRGMVDGAEKAKILEGYVSGFRGVWEVLVGMCALGLVVGLGIRHFSMDRLLLSKFSLRRSSETQG